MHSVRLSEEAGIAVVSAGRIRVEGIVGKEYVGNLVIMHIPHHVAGEIVLRGGEQFQQQGCGDVDQQLRPAFERLYEFVKHLHNICNERSVVENSYKDNAKILVK